MKTNKVQRVLIILCCVVLALGMIILMQPKPKYYDTLDVAKENSDVGDNSLVIEGEKSARIVGNKDTVYLVKEENGWKESTGRAIITKSIKKLNGATIHIAEYNFLKDYYISITGVANPDVDISDNRNTVFFIKDNSKDNAEDKTYTFLACVHAPGKDYQITIDGVSVIMFK